MTTKDYYEVYAYDGNPAFEDCEASYKYHAMTNKELLGILKILVDELHVESITVFRIGSPKGMSEVQAQKTLSEEVVH